MAPVQQERPEEVGWHPEHSPFFLAENESTGGCGLLHTSRKVSGPSAGQETFGPGPLVGTGGGFSPEIAHAAPLLYYTGISHQPRADLLGLPFWKGMLVLVGRGSQGPPWRREQVVTAGLTHGPVWGPHST